MKDKHGKVIYEPYQIRVLNTINFKKSMHYNPFSYIHSEKDILKLVTTLIANTKGEGKEGMILGQGGTLLYCALIGYITMKPPPRKEFLTLLELSTPWRCGRMTSSKTGGLMFDELEAKPHHFAVKQYKKYKLAAGDVCSK